MTAGRDAHLRHSRRTPDHWTIKAVVDRRTRVSRFIDSLCDFKSLHAFAVITRTGGVFVGNALYRLMSWKKRRK